VSDWYNLNPNEVLERLGTDPERGLDPEEAAKRLAALGPNELVDRGVKNPWLIIWEQLTGIMVVILIVAAVISVFLREYTDASVIMIIVIINAALGFSQEYRAEKAMAALKRLAVPFLGLPLSLLPLQILWLGRPHNCAICDYTITTAPNNARRLP